MATPVTGLNPVRLFLLGAFADDIVFVPPLPPYPDNPQDLRNIINAAVARVDPDMVTRLAEQDGLSQRCLSYYQRRTH